VEEVHQAHSPIVAKTLADILIQSFRSSGFINNNKRGFIITVLLSLFLFLSFKIKLHDSTGRGSREKDLTKSAAERRRSSPPLDSA